jgi:hypothetical protein
MEIAIHWIFPPSTPLFVRTDHGAIRQTICRQIFNNMKDRQFFDNLDTSFIKLEALVRYLTSRAFTGTIYVKFAGYTGEITFTANRRLRVTEKDQIAGRVIGGEKAYRSIISRSAEPGGIVNVVQSLGATQHMEAPVTADMSGSGEVIDISNRIGTLNGNSKIMPHVRIKPRATEPRQNGGSLFRHIDLPFDLTNHFEARAAAETDLNVDLELLIDVTSDLLSTIDNALCHAGLDFSAALEKACSDVSERHAFLDPQKRLFRYSQGFVYISPKNDLKSFTRGLGDVLERIFYRLNANTKYGKVHRFAVQRVRKLMHTRRDEFERSGMFSNVERSLVM